MQKASNAQAQPPSVAELRAGLKHVSALARQLGELQPADNIIASLHQLSGLRSDIRDELKRQGALPSALVASTRIRSSNTPPPAGYDPQKPLTLAIIGGFAAEALRTQRHRASAGRIDVARIATTFPDDRRLTGSDGFANIATIAKAQRQAQDAEAPSALTAALCGPLEPVYDIPQVGELHRPVRDALLRFQADRGGIQYRAALDWNASTGAVGTWTSADDDEDPLVPKTCLDVDCPDVLSAEVQAVYRCLTMPNFMAQFDPEQTEAAQYASLVAHAALAENELLSALLAGSKLLTVPRTLGAARDVLVAVDRAAAYLRSRHRLGDGLVLRWVAPEWVLNMIRSDVARQHAGSGVDALSVADQEILDWFNVRRIRPTWHADGLPEQTVGAEVIPAQRFAVAAAGSALPGYPAKIDSVLFAEGTWLHLDGGELDLGVVRDSELNSQNRLQFFAESFETAVDTGIESLRLVIATEPTGLSAGVVDTSAVTD